MHRRLTYANVTATLALFFAMSGGALAAKHYLISSTKQINPKVLKALKGNRGATGATGAAGAAGAAGKEGPAGKEGKAGPEGKPGAPGTTLFARVKNDGTLQAGSGAVSAAEKAPGEYEVVFDRNVSACAYEATLGSASVSAENTVFDSEGPGEILAEPRAGDPNAVYVETATSQDITTANSFHLAVFC
jgi:Collagen triple helix repeat (20 copies)